MTNPKGLNITVTMADGTPMVIKDLQVEYMAPGFGLDLETFEIRRIYQPKRHTMTRPQRIYAAALALFVGGYVIYRKWAGK